MRLMLSMLLSAALAATSLADGLETEAAAEPVRNARVVYYDGEFLFMARNYGSSRDSAGPTEPGLFVHCKRHDAWFQLKRVSTAGAKFGRTRSDDPAERAVLERLSVGWDFSSLAQMPQVELPLKTGGSIALPDRIELDERHDAYVLRFNSQLKISVAETTLRVSRGELFVASGAVERSRKKP